MSLAQNVFFVRLCLNVSRVMNWRLVQGVPGLSPSVSWDRLHSIGPVVVDNGWMD